jgi:hypothetical protein
MQERLESEGVLIRDNTVADMESHFWHPRELENV